MALLTLGSCAGTTALTSTENDGVYYSSKDRTTALNQAVVASTEPAPAAEEDGDVANPDYAGTTTSQATGSTEYYDDDFYAARLRRFHQPAYRGLGLGYYDFAYTDPFWYGGPVYSAWGPGAFYDPFYGPYWGGSFVNITIGLGRPWYRPWRGYGYGYGAYDYGYGYGYSPYGYGNPWGGYYGGGFYGGGGFYNGYYGGRGIRAQAVRSVVTGTRSRLSDGELNAGGNLPGSVSGSRSRGVVEGGLLAPSTTTSSATVAPAPASGRGRSRDVVTGGVQPGATTETRAVEATPAAQPTRRWRVLSESGSSTATQAGTETSRPRRNWDNVGGSRPQTTDAGGVVAEPRRQRVYQQPTRSSDSGTGSEPTRSYSQPSRSYSEPSRSYSEPSRSYSQPSRSFDGGGSSGGGGRSGGGNGGGGGSSSGGRGRGN
ncbi:hypothetical protein GCM10027175_37500 [Hymenobacter latericoloratus]